MLADGSVSENYFLARLVHFVIIDGSEKKVPDTGRTGSVGPQKAGLAQACPPLAMVIRNVHAGGLLPHLESLGLAR